MLSSENPSCSSKDSDLASGHGDHQAKPPNFSIRDYVFKSRSKDISTNWPFHEQLLELCLNNGINDLLPPLQPPNLVRDHCLRKEVRPEQLPKCVENKTAFENEESEEDVELEHLIRLPKERIEFKLNQSGQSDINASSVTSHDLSEKIAGEHLKKKCKMSSGKEISRLEDSVVVSDPMASKYNATREVTEFTKPKVKPRKKRLMVDIYTTAPHCTLEDLDRRNGTNWATTLAPVAPANGIGLETERSTFATSPPENDTNSESKRVKFASLDVVSEGKLGDIYVDSNGTKLLILSQPNESSPLVPRNNFKPKKYGKGLKASQSCSNIAKKKFLKPKSSEFMIDNPQRRKLRMRKGFQGENKATTDEYYIEVNQEKEESMSQLLNAHDQVKNSEASTLGHWVCSKRSDLSKKLDNKGITKGSEKMTVGSRKLSFECPKPNSGRSYLASNQTKILSPRESLQEKSDLPRQSISLKGMEVDRFITAKKFKKQRSVLGCSKWRGEKTSVNGGISGSKNSSEGSGLISSRENETSKTHQSNYHENQEIENMNIRYSMSNAVVTPALDPSSEEDVESISRGQTEEEDEESTSRGQTEEEDEESISRDQNEEEEEESISRDQNEEEDEESISRDRAQAEAETSTYNQEVNCGGATNNEVINQEIQIACYQDEQILQHGELDQTEASSFEDPKPCFPNDGEIAVENIQDDSSKYIRVESFQDHNMIIDMESSGSAVSTTSTISPRSTVDDRINSHADQLADFTPVQDNLSLPTMRKDNKALLSPQVREPSCSCGDSLTRESQFSKKAASNLFIKPPPFSTFEVRSSLDLHTESVLTTDSPKSAMNISTPHSGVQSASSPILRLMGKDLVVSKEESVSVPRILPCTSSCNPETNFISFGYPYNGGFIDYNNQHHYPMQSTGNYQIMPRPLQRSYALNSYPMPTIPSNQLQEVIVIDDDSHGREHDTRASFTNLPQTIQNPNHMATQRLFACFPSQNPYASRAVISHSQREASQGQGSFIFPSPSCLYFSPSLR
ncbi:uncharacterized protein LOC109840148 isoform X2 [Asparagus officinalis]|uniref:uncharacterized protein LOC109840148 isoform X2 n=1 Tax=Asparagus officinalis TaxID=4686 RepID=UPI00098E7D6B|nr:uncharacterized protein LOC109840148 isoform X2 [Asparagus officinalis]